MALTFHSGVDTPEGHVCTLVCSCGERFIIDPKHVCIEDLTYSLREHFGPLDACRYEYEKRGNEEK